MVEFNGALYSYVHNLQGDVVGIVDNAGSLVVEYKYDAWGKSTLVRTLTTEYETLAELNPFRYRGYVYDEETGLYYLRSRYYASALCRFVNSDTFIGVSSLLSSHNVFCYCYNVAPKHKDANGKFAIAATGTLTYKFIEGSLIFLTMMGLISKSSTPDVNPSHTSNDTPSNTSGKTVEEELGEIAGQYGDLECVAARDAIVDYLLTRNLSYTVIELQFSPIPGYVYSNMYDRQISENGYHVGVEYNGNVYCNVHPLGLPEQTWIDDFEAAFNEPPVITRFSVTLE